MFPVLASHAEELVAMEAQAGDAWAKFLGALVSAQWNTQGATAALAVVSAEVRAVLEDVAVRVDEVGTSSQASAMKDISA